MITTNTIEDITGGTIMDGFAIAGTTAQNDRDTARSEVTEWLLFVIHHWVNAAWWKNLSWGQYSAARILGIMVNLLLAVIMAALPVSGMMMSRHTFSFLNLNAYAFYARTIHLLAAYWGFVLMSFHAGLHWKEVVDMCKAIADMRQEGIDIGRQVGRQEEIGIGRQEGIGIGIEQGELKKAKETALNLYAIGMGAIIHPE